MNAATEEAPHVSMGDLKKFPMPVRKVVSDAVNNHGVGIRFMDDGAHLRLYNGDRKVFPCKIASVRPAEHTMRYLIPWLEQNVPTWLKREVGDTDLEALAEVLNSEPKKPKESKSVTVGDVYLARAEAESDKVEDGKEWTPYKHGLETNGTDYRCMVKGCDYYHAGDRKGIHLHQKKHSGEAAKDASKAGKAWSLKRQQRDIMRQEAVRLLAEQNHMVVVPKEQAVAGAKYEELVTQNAMLKRELDDLKARLALMKEAMDV